MKAETSSQIKTSVSITVDGINFPEGTLGAVVEAYSNPEGYTVDLAIPDDKLVGSFRYYNVILTPEQFEVFIDKAQTLS